jgi:hypothetical protein
MITGILGSDESVPRPRMSTVQKASACGNGKTITLAYLGWKEYLKSEKAGKPRKIISNFHTRFPGGQFGQASWSEYRSNQEIFDKWWDEKNKGALILITELQSIFNSCNRNNKIIAYIERCLVQRRKMGYEVVYDSQELGSVDKRFRNMTDYIYVPMKFHAAYVPQYKEYVPVEPCPLDTCSKAHIIQVYRNYPFPKSFEEMSTPVLKLKAWVVGQLFDTNEQMVDMLQYDQKWDHLGV